MVAAVKQPKLTGSRPVNIDALFSDLLAAHGPQHWWPARSRFEIAVGAVLVQRTAWRNAELAIEALRDHRLLDPVRLAESSPTKLAELVRPAGFARAKAVYLVSLARFVTENAGLDALGKTPTAQLRNALLAVHGIGPETADSILLYLFRRPAWVADAYATRLLSRITGQAFDIERQQLLMRAWVEAGRTADLQELHAVIVAHGKSICRSTPFCRRCSLGAGCDYARRLRTGE